MPSTIVAHHLRGGEANAACHGAADKRDELRHAFRGDLDAHLVEHRHDELFGDVFPGQLAAGVGDGGHYKELGFGIQAFDLFRR
ncbi:hypothetical protein [Halomonas sp. hl-4]|uniref:hypothetical protein n=1 Tax=Halomonas sp. hl-4 TaxID=1761789 RepID=UPI001E3AE869|nr:hypothetical protein [Halomonas sp. hl-4]